MFGLFSKKTEHKEMAIRLYESINAQARLEAFYTQYGVADTTDGRFDLICLHSFLIMSRLQQEGKEGRYISQALFDIMFKQLERALREMGVGDLSVPRHVKRMMTAYKGRYHAYEEALKSDNNAMLAEVIKRNVYGHDDSVRKTVLDDIANYIRSNHAHVNGMSFEEFSTGQGLFPHGLSKGGNDETTSNQPRMVA